MLHAIPSTFGSFFALRFVLGMLESCVAPILIIIISMFYKKDEQASRISWFFVMVSVSESLIIPLLTITCIFRSA
jgi:ACS family allantoate permease-like MFS transporter